MSILPASRPKATHADILKHVVAAGLSIGEERAVLVGVRGYYRDSMGKVGRNDQAMYDDAMFLITPTGVVSWNANTDPQKAGQKKAMLAPGLYSFYKGKHKGKYDALRPYPEGVTLPCTRDGKTSMCSHTNIHKGGFNDTFSEGCQTIYPTQWPGFINAVYDQMKRAGKKTIRYALVENSE